MSVVFLNINIWLVTTDLYYSLEVRRWLSPGTPGFLHYLQIASHELATIGINVTKNEIPISKFKILYYY